MIGKRKRKRLGKVTSEIRVRVPKIDWATHSSDICYYDLIIKKPKINKTIIRKKIKAMYDAIQVLTDDTGFDEMEKLMARVAYLNLNALRNSLHRLLVNKK